MEEFGIRRQHHGGAGAVESRPISLQRPIEVVELRIDVIGLGVDLAALGVALPYAIANAVFGGTAEYVALWFKQAGWERGFYWYVTAVIGVSLVTYWRMRDTRDASRIVED